MNDRIKVVVPHKDEESGRDGWLHIGNRWYTTSLNYDEVELTPQEIYEHIDKCIPVYTVDAIENENTHIFHWLDVPPLRLLVNDAFEEELDKAVLDEVKSWDTDEISPDLVKPQPMTFPLTMEMFMDVMDIMDKKKNK